MRELRNAEWMEVYLIGLVMSSKNNKEFLLIPSENPSINSGADATS
jgi:hypothetical protein